MAEPSNPEKTHAPAQEGGGMESAGGEMRKAPAFSLSAGAPLQRFVGRQGTNYRLDSGPLREEDLQDESITSAIQAMDLTALQQLRNRNHDPAVLDFIQRRIDQRQPEVTPPAGRIRPVAPNVDPRQQAMFDQFRTYFNGLPARFEAFLANTSNPESAPIRNSANARAAIEGVRRAAAYLNSPSFPIRFVSVLPPGMMARYDTINNEIQVFSFGNDQQRAEVAASFAHEFTHSEQDQAEEQALMNNPSGRHGLTEGEDFQHERGAWKVGSFVVRMLHGIGDLVLDMELALERGMTSHFDTADTGTPRERRNAEQNIHNTLDGVYRSQFQHNGRIVNYHVRIDHENHARLVHPRTGERDLGLIPTTIDNPYPLQGHIRDQIFAQPDALELLEDRAAHRSFESVLFTVAYAGRRITEFALARSEFPQRRQQHGRRP